MDKTFWFITHLSLKLSCQVTAINIYIFLYLHITGEDKSSYGGVANVLYCNIIESEFKLQSDYYVHFLTNSFGKGMTPVILPKRMDLTLKTP